MPKRTVCTEQWTPRPGRGERAKRNRNSYRSPYECDPGERSRRRRQYEREARRLVARYGDMLTKKKLLLLIELRRSIFNRPLRDKIFFR